MHSSPPHPTDFEDFPILSRIWGIKSSPIQNQCYVPDFNNNQKKNNQKLMQFNGSCLWF